MKDSLFKRIIISGISIALIIIVSGVALTAILYDKFVVRKYDESAEKCALAIQDVLIGFGTRLDTVADDPYSYDSIREMIRANASLFDFKYAYMYRPGPTEGTREYIFAVAPDNFLDDKVYQIRYYGTIVDVPFREVEQQVFEGTIPYGTTTNTNQFGRVYTWYVPFKDRNGEIKALIAFDYDASEYYLDLLKNSLYYVIPALFFLIAMLVLFSISIHRHIFVPMRLLSSKMRSYIPGGDIDLSDIKRQGEIDEIASSFEMMSDTITTYISDIKELSLEKANASAELNIARKIQSGIVPGSLSLKKDLYEVEAYACPAREVGGDFYTCFEVGRYLYMLIGDVSGKGIAASMFMTVTLSVVREKLRSGLSPAEALNASNSTLCEENPEGMFVTLFACIYDSFTGELRFANAGHTKPLLITSDKHFIEPEPGIALGLFDDPDIVDDCIFLKNGEGIMFYTDGVTDATDPDKNFFGEDRMLTSVDPSLGASNTNVLEKNIKDFIKDTPRFDDTTIFTLFHTKEPEHVVSYTVTPELESYDDFKDAMIEALGMNATTRKMLLACEEIFSNIVDYSGTDSIDLLFAADEHTAVVRYEDNGIEFDPTSPHLPQKDFDEMDTGGMGIMIVKQIASEIRYNRINGRNILTLTFEKP